MCPLARARQQCEAVASRIEAVPAAISADHETAALLALVQHVDHDQVALVDQCVGPNGQIEDFAEPSVTTPRRVLQSDSALVWSGLGVFSKAQAGFFCSA